MDTGTHPRAGLVAEPGDLIDVAKLVDAYYSGRPDVSVPEQRVSFGTSGHRGSSLNQAFNEAHIVAIAQAICEYRRSVGVSGPLFLGRDTHALSEPAMISAVEVFAANDVTVMIDSRSGFTPTPAVSHAILRYNAGRGTGLADGVVVTPSHNPPADGGFKYNPPNGGPADTDVTRTIQDRANALLERGLAEVRRVPSARALEAPTTKRFDFLDSYVGDLPEVVDLRAVRDAGLRIGADPLGGASVRYWEEIGSRYELDLTVVNPAVDPTWRFMTLDWDGKIRMDCSSAYAMAGLIAGRSKYDVAVGNDADADRHGIVTPDAGLLGPNQYLAVAVDYLFRTRSRWPSRAAVGKTVVSSSMIDRVAADLGRPLAEVPVGFKWFVAGLLDASIGFGGEESAGAAFLRHDGTVWTTDKDGIVLCLLAAEIAALTGRSPSQHHDSLVQRFGPRLFARIDAPATRPEREILGRLSADQISNSELAGEPITEILTRAPGNDAPIGGVKVVSEGGWFAARPSGTEDVYKIYAESARDEEHLARIQDDARRIVSAALSAQG
jgi:phosphoglucomutase